MQIFNIPRGTYTFKTFSTTTKAVSGNYKLKHKTNTTDIIIDPEFYDILSEKNSNKHLE